jgi:hypothetical protein
MIKFMCKLGVFGGASTSGKSQDFDSCQGLFVSYRNPSQIINFIEAISFLEYPLGSPKMASSWYVLHPSCTQNFASVFFVSVHKARGIQRRTRLSVRSTAEGRAFV